MDISFPQICIELFNSSHSRGWGYVDIKRGKSFCQGQRIKSAHIKGLLIT